MATYATAEAVREFERQIRELPIKIEPLPARFWEDEHWLVEHLTELTRTYPEQWVAVYQKQVVGVGNSRREARERAQAKVGDVGPLVVVYMEYKTYVYPAGPADL